MDNNAIVNAVTQSDPRDADDFRRIVMIAVLSARLDEWSHIPALTAARHRARMADLFKQLQELHRQ